MSGERERASNGIRGNSAYFAIVGAHYLALEILFALHGIQTGTGHAPLAIALWMVVFYFIIFFPLALLVVLVNWWFRFTLAAYLASATLVLGSINWMLFLSRWPFLEPRIVYFVAATLLPLPLLAYLWKRAGRGIAA
jgi:hypothetical protein